MSRLRLVSTLLFVGVALLGSSLNGGAFALLGSFKSQTNNAADPWQGKPYAGLPGGLGYELSSAIGGPMFLNEAYRWNVPVIYYGFDQAFVDYFGEPGIEAVRSAFAILNALPPASEMSTNLVEFPLHTKAHNSDANNLLDIKSHVLPLLLEQLGLANPERFTWGLRNRSVDANQGQMQTNYSVLQMNYDPVTWRPSSSVNDVVYHYRIFDPWPWGAPGDEFAVAAPWFELNPAVPGYNSVAGAWGSNFDLGSSPNISRYSYDYFRPGDFFSGLTRDDVGGLRFLLSRTNRVVEPLLPGVVGVDSGTSSVVNIALRGGVEKLTFMRLPLNGQSNRFACVTNVFEDVYFRSNVACTQLVQRVVSQPDILFAAEDMEAYFDASATSGSFFTGRVTRTGTGHWQNNSSINGQIGAGGPGVINPGAKLAFNRLGRLAFARDREVRQFAPHVYQWATFTDERSPIVTHYGPLPTNDLVHLKTSIEVIDGIRSIQSWFHSEIDHSFNIETSVDLINWELWFVRENPSGVFSIDHPLDGPHRFLRVTRAPWSF